MPTSAAACSGMEYQCRDGTRCISVSQQCDGHADCNDSDDEEHCDGSEYQSLPDDDQSINQSIHQNKNNA